MFIQKWSVILLAFIFSILFYFAFFSHLESNKPSNVVRAFHKLREKTDTLGFDESEIEKNEVRILCIVNTLQRTAKKTMAVKDTWGKRCNKLLFISDVTDTHLGTIASNLTEGRKFLWGKIKAAFKYAWDNYKEEADWFLKADDDTFFIVENLKYFLKNFSTTDPIYFGCKFTPDEAHLYASGGSGYVLSKESVRRFVDNTLPDEKICRPENTGSEDWNMGDCLKNVGVELVDSRDDLGKHRFNVFSPDYHLAPNPISGKYPPWFTQYMHYPQDQGLESCSDTSISFHYVTPSVMYVLEYFIYHLHKYDDRTSAITTGSPTISNSFDTTGSQKPYKID